MSAENCIYGKHNCYMNDMYSNEYGYHKFHLLLLSMSAKNYRRLNKLFLCSTVLNVPKSKVPEHLDD